eukprot:Skav226425  [mRNA]  locus=scaffold2653:36574:36879:- [translate_table: standard]
MKLTEGFKLKRQQRLAQLWAAAIADLNLNVPQLLAPMQQVAFRDICRATLAAIQRSLKTPVEVLRLDSGSKQALDSYGQLRLQSSNAPKASWKASSCSVLS